MSAARIRRLSLSNFRSYRAASLAVDAQLCVLVGPNGAGKTNLIEAISFLAPGRGLRRATLDEVAFAEGNGAWAVAAEVEGAAGLATLGTGIEQPAADATTLSRKTRIDGEPVSSTTALTDHVSIVWMTPAMDGLFGGPASERRRFLDRLVLAIDGTHSTRVNALERSLRSRNRLLEQPGADPHWLDAVEHETAEVAIAVAAARAEAVRRLAAALSRDRDSVSPFPWAGISLSGWIENALLEQPAGDVEDRYRVVLRENRGRDAAAGRTTDGAHLTDLEVLYGPKGIAAAQASTGEQKALLIGLVLAHAGLVAEMTRFAPLLLLDEVIAHLDPGRRAALYDALAALDAQVWMTGADPAPFADIKDRAQVFAVSPGRVAPEHAT
jgi:DNA replication and repair protein RecF